MRYLPLKDLLFIPENYTVRLNTALDNLISGINSLDAPDEVPPDTRGSRLVSRAFSGIPRKPSGHGRPGDQAGRSHLFLTSFFTIFMGILSKAFPAGKAFYVSVFTCPSFRGKL